MTLAGAPALAGDGGIEDFLHGMLDHAEGWAPDHKLPADRFATGSVGFSLRTLGATYRRRLTTAIDFARGGGPAPVGIELELGARRPPPPTPPHKGEGSHFVLPPPGGEGRGGGAEPHGDPILTPMGPRPLRIIALDGKAGPGTPPGWHFRVTDASHLQRLHERPGLICRYDPDWGTWYVLSRTRNLAVTWTADAAGLPEWEDSCPLRDILHWHSSDHDWLLVHAAGIGADGAGVLLAGAGGSGKSTTTAACVLAGLQTTGDDFVVVDPVRRRAHAIYDTIKLDAGSLAALPDWQCAVANPERPADQKARLHVAQSRPEALARGGLALKAILLPRVTGATESAIVPVSAAEAMRALAPSTMFLLRGGAAASMRKITALLRALPAFRLDLGRDPMEAAAAVGRFLGSA